MIEQTKQKQIAKKRKLTEKKQFVVSNLRFFDSENCFYAARNDENNIVFFISKNHNR